jgi:hypothetical protein
MRKQAKFRFNPLFLPPLFSPSQPPLSSFPRTRADADSTAARRCCQAPLPPGQLPTSPAVFQPAQAGCRLLQLVAWPLAPPTAA